MFAFPNGICRAEDIPLSLIIFALGDADTTTDQTGQSKGQDGARHLW